MRILVVDGLRHAQLTGYGMLARSLIMGLADAGHVVGRQAALDTWDDIETGSRERIEALPILRPADVDLVLQIGTPQSCRAYPVPTLMYTQNALGDLPDDWVTALEHADGLIVPGEFDRKVFARYFSRVYIAQQSSPSTVFSPAPTYRKEGSKNFTFMFVGSYSFRKGVDVLLTAFLREFGPDENVELDLRCAGSGGGEQFNHLLSYIQRINPLARVKFHAGPLSPNWMRRIYNRADCVVTMSRGEGWCMPLTEALLCEIPVIAPCSTAMGEYLDDTVAYMVETRDRPIERITDPFGKGFAKMYRKPGNVCYEPDVGGARRAFREVFTHQDAARAKAKVGAARIRDEVNWESSVRSVVAACEDLLGAQADVKESTNTA